ncbi:MAG TPA: DUF4468 domain-containing protein [Cytophagaceae bacterium]|jgi:hypothetical protein|nr:DUF4468 domain-containing protein [Cytophagaceae bacterium]
MDTKIKYKRLFPMLVWMTLFLSFYINSNAQVVMPRDENGKIIYQDVVKVDSVPQDSIFKRINNWVNYTYPKTKKNIDTAMQKISTRGRFIVYINPGVLREIHGAIRYDVSIEVKQKRYRYTFTNFVFEYYKQDKFYKYNPTGKEKPLEDEKFPQWQGPWEKHKNTTDAQVKAKIEDLWKAVNNKKAETMVIPTVKKNSDW